MACSTLLTVTSVELPFSFKALNTQAVSLFTSHIHTHRRPLTKRTSEKFALDACLKLPMFASRLG